MNGTFSAQGITAQIAVTAANQTLTLAITGDTATKVRLRNVGTDEVYFAFGAAANTTSSMSMGAGHTEMFELPPGISTIGVIGATGGLSTLRATPGNGV